MHGDRRKIRLSISFLLPSRASADRFCSDSADKEEIASKETDESSTMIRSGSADVTVKIAAHWFRDPTGYRHAILAAIETALAA
jgi:hypothetical protein